MDDGDGEGDTRTFRVNFSGEGLASLRGTVKEKLKEFLGDYTDDTLAEYVIVLLRNGRHKEEARKELGVFLEKDSVAFVSWLWDHLSSNLHLYLPPEENLIDGDDNLTPTSGGSNDNLEQVSGGIKSDSENGRKRPVKESSNRRNREWRGLVQDETDSLHQSTTIENALQEKISRKHSPIRRSRSPRPLVHEKRRRQDEQQTTKQDLNVKPILGAPSRLLQFAVRDAVKTAQRATTRSESPSTRSEPALKRLRSVVSTSTIDSAPDEVHQRTRVATRLSGGMATAVRAAAEAANDTTRSRSSRNVFSRLGHAVDDSLVHKESSGKEANRRYSEQNLGLKGHDYPERNEHDEESMLEMMGINEQARTASGSGSDDENYSNVKISRPMTIDGSRAQSVSFVHQGKETLMGQHIVTPNTEEVARQSRIKDEHPPVAAASNTSHKIVNTSVNINTWKPPHNQSQREAMIVSQIREEKMETIQHNMAVQLPTGSNANSLKNVEETARANGEKGTPKSMTSTIGSYSTTRPSEDADSRTIFVSNVHFAATKDTLSRHFNKFGEVLKVIIVTDAATGQPIGSAYVEFLRNESAELALSLNGTSFMSRILKVVLGSSAHHEAAAMSPWSRGASWGQPYPARAGGSYPFSRAAATFGGAFGRRLPIKAGARSLQWKRESPSPATDGGKHLQNSPLPGSGGGGLLSPTARSLTYVRSKPKPDEAAA